MHIYFFKERETAFFKSQTFLVLQCYILLNKVKFQQLGKSQSSIMWEQFSKLSRENEMHFIYNLNQKYCVLLERRVGAVVSALALHQ